MKQQILKRLLGYLIYPIVFRYPSFSHKMNEMLTTSQNCRLLDAKWQLWENTLFIGNHIRFLNGKIDRIRGCTCVKIRTIKSDILCSCEFDKSIAEKIKIAHVIENDKFCHYQCCYLFWKSPCRQLWSIKSPLALTIHVQWIQEANQLYQALLAAPDPTILSVSIKLIRTWIPIKMCKNQILIR